MRITKIVLENFKAFKGTHSIDTNHNLICFVGENNTGKSTIFSALNFLRNGTERGKTIDEYKNAENPNDEVAVEITLAGRIEEFATAIDRKVILPYIVESAGIQQIRLRRSSEKQEITQNNRKVKIDETKLTIYNPETEQFENPTGIDAGLKALFDIEFIHSDLLSGEIADFGATKILGRLVTAVAAPFQESEAWKLFQEAHQEAFMDGPNGLGSLIDEMEQNLQGSLTEFYGAATLKFKFDTPDPKIFFQQGTMLVNDGVETPVSEKGSGMRRALALSIIRVYADMLRSNEAAPDSQLPLFFCIDEPEISLHPKAQSTLFEALQKISTRQQVFIATHSPHLLQTVGFEQSKIHIIRNSDGPKLSPISKLKTFPFSPTIAEIHYYAYDLPSTDFHNELYGFLVDRSGKYQINQFDLWLQNSHNIPADKSWIKVMGDSEPITQNVTLMTYIRHSIHHPENTQNSPFTHTELEHSIAQMITIANANPPPTE